MARKVEKQENRKPQAWQLDPENITTKTVQFWRNGIMITAMVTNEQAKEMVQNGNAFVITSQAIGALTEDGCYNS